LRRDNQDTGIMRTLLSSAFPSGLLGLILLCLFMLVTSDQVRAVEPTQPGLVSQPVANRIPLQPRALVLVLADDDGWSIRKVFTSINSRARVVQLCVVTMCIALVILIKK
jgi:hypothetical protein